VYFRQLDIRLENIGWAEYIACPLNVTVGWASYICWIWWNSCISISNVTHTINAIYQCERIVFTSREVINVPRHSNPTAFQPVDPVVRRLSFHVRIAIVNQLPAPLLLLDISMIVSGRSQTPNNVNC